MSYINSTNTIQATYSPMDYTFQWTEDWYTFDTTEGKRLALAARKAEMARLKREGWTVKPFSLGQQLISRGGIGSGRPHIELVVNVYGFNAWKA